MFAIIVLFLVCMVLKYCETSSEENKENNKNAIRLLKKSMQWNLISHQDKNAIIAYQHINLSIAYLNAARECASDAILEQATKSDLYTYNKKIHNRQSQLFTLLSELEK